MKNFLYHLSNQGVNFDVIFNDLWPFTVVPILFIMWMIIYDNKGSRARYADTESLEQQIRLEKELSDARDRIAVLSISNELFAEQVKTLQDLNKAISKQIRKRNAKGQYVKSHVTNTPVPESTERDWTKATKEELLDEAKRRYPVGIKYIGLMYNLEEESEYTARFFIDTLNVEVGIDYVFFNGQWAKIIPSC